MDEANEAYEERAHANQMLLIRDAQRYRWLRDEAARNKGSDEPGALVVSITRLQRRSDGLGFTGRAVTPIGADFDAAIDAAMKGANASSAPK